jgi:hypothetical protein
MMDVSFAPSFFKSLKKMRLRSTWWYKTYEYLCYDLPNFFKNAWRFRKALTHHRWWDYRGTLLFMETSLSHIADGLETKGNEVDVSRLKKVQKIRRAVEIIHNIQHGDYIDRAEAELGLLPESTTMSDLLAILNREDTPEEATHRRKVYDRAEELEEKEWEELWTILKGQNHTAYVMLMGRLTQEEKRQKDRWNEWFDGSGLRGWWD